MSASRIGAPDRADFPRGAANGSREFRQVRGFGKKDRNKVAAIAALAKLIVYAICW
jgi:hypothetical protein